MSLCHHELRHSDQITKSEHGGDRPTAEKQNDWEDFKQLRQQLASSARCGRLLCARLASYAQDRPGLSSRAAWTIEEHNDACFIVKAATGQALVQGLSARTLREIVDGMLAKRGT